MAAPVDLVSVGLIEKDVYGDVLWTWSYPSVTEKQRKLFLQKCGLLNEEKRNQVSFLYSKQANNWYYIAICIVTPADLLPQVREFALVLSSKDFNPEKYRALSQLLCQAYRRSGAPVSILESYLGVITKGVCQSQTNGVFSVREYSPKEAYTTGWIKDFISCLSLESILVYTAVLLKRRLVVYHPRLDELLGMIRCIPALVWHRQNWDILHPYLSLDYTDTQPLRSQAHYVAGFVDAAVEARTDLYDVFVNMASNEVTVASHAKDSFVLGKLHKDIATAMVDSAQNQENTEEQVIKDIALKTSDLLTSLRTFSGDETKDGRPQISLETLQQRKIPQNTEKFLFNLASAEGWVQL